eukprot:6474147-Amphidinium_carterae.1
MDAHLWGKYEATLSPPVSQEGSIVELPDVVTERKRGETTEERRERKAAVKEFQRQCRKMKKDICKSSGELCSNPSPRKSKQELAQVQCSVIRLYGSSYCPTCTQPEAFQVVH